MSLFASVNLEQIENNATIYAEDISLYNQKINEYAKQFQNLKLTDLQVIMKVIDDMWNSIAGYGMPENDIYGFSRLTFLEDDKYGVCRNIADDVAAKLNAINSKYNARTLTVYMENLPVELSNIERKIQNQELALEESQNIIDITKIFGNHLVTLVDIPDENITLVVDPTNPNLGIFRNGYIYIF